MHRTLIVLSLFGGLTSAVSLSLGVLTPEVVRNLGQALGKYVFSKPSSTILKAAYAKVVDPDAGEHLRGWLNQCIVEFAVEVLTAVISFFLSLLLLLSLSVWGFVDAARPGSHRIQWGLSVIGILVCISGVCDAVQFGSGAGELGKTVGKLLQRPWKVAQPLEWVLYRFVSVFTKTAPLFWYRSLKTVHSRGINWLFTLAGVLLAVVSFSLQLYAVLTTRP
jgi:hypothetical protein